MINEVLDAECPDLVVLNGDLITGENTFLENSTAYVDQIVAPLVQRGLTWASTYGNHDSDYNISREGILARERRWPNARTAQMVPGRDAGVSNYYLPVYGSNCTITASDGGGGGDVAGNCTPQLILWFFDSRGGFYYQAKDAAGNRVGQPNWVDISVVDWFTQTSAALAARYGGGGQQHRAAPIPSLAFVHIPTNASLALQTQKKGSSGGGVHPHYQPGINDDVPLAQQAQGWCADGTDGGGGGGAACSYGAQDVPFMRAIASTPGLAAVFSGHDHGDTWCYRWDGRGVVPGVVPVMPENGSSSGVDLCFGQHSGYGGYGTWTRGARQVRVSEAQLREYYRKEKEDGAKVEVDTWIRLERGGGVVGAVTLNATYGRDYYPATPDTHTTCPTCNYSVVTAVSRRRRQKGLQWAG